MHGTYPPAAAWTIFLSLGILRTFGTGTEGAEAPNPTLPSWSSPKPKTRPLAVTKRQCLGPPEGECSIEKEVATLIRHQEGESCVSRLSY